MTGFAAIGLHNPKSGVNVGGALRAATVYGAKLVAIDGARPQRYIKHCTDTTKAYRNIPLVIVEDLFDALPYDCMPIAIEMLPGARALPEFTHPPRAFYIFGPEDSSLGASVLERCAHKVIIPTSYCMNLAATVNVVLYDRLAKRGQQ